MSKKVTRRLEKADKKAKDEDDRECPGYVFLKRGVDGSLQLEIPSAYRARFKPVKEATYKRWLKEKSEDPEALRELAEDEMDPRDKEDQ